MVLQLHHRGGVLNEATADQPGGQQGKSGYIHLAQKYRPETETRNGKGRQTTRPGRRKRMLMCHKTFLLFTRYKNYSCMQT